MLRVRLLFLFVMFCFASSAVSLLAQQQATVEHFVGSEGGVGTRDGRGAEARFNGPRGIWSDGTFAYVPDRGNSTIRRIELATGDVKTIAGTPQQPQAGRIVNPQKIWGQGSFLYFIDGLVIRRLEISTGAITTFAGSTSGTADGIGEQAQLRGPYAITGNTSHIYFLDSPLITHGVFWDSPALIREISISSGQVRTLPLPPIPPTALPYDVDPTALWADDDFLYLTFVSSPGSVALGRMSLRDFQFTPLAGFPLPPADSRYFPRNLWSDGFGNFFFSAGSNIRQFVLSTGEVSPVASAPPAASSAVSGIWGTGDMLFATDGAANVVFQVNLATKQASTLAGLAYTAPSRDEDIRPLSGAGALWRQGAFFYLLDPSLSLIHKIDAGTGSLTTFVPYIHAPLGIWGDDSFLYVTQPQDSKVSKVSLETGEVSTLSTGLVHPALITGDSTYLYVTDGDVTRRITKLDGTADLWDISRIGFRNVQAIWTDGMILYELDDAALRKIDLVTLQAVVVANAWNYVAYPSLPVLAPGARTLWSDGRFIYVGATGTLQRIDPAARELTVLASGFGFQDGIADAGLGVPKGIWNDAQYVYFVDRALRRLNLATREVTTWVGRALRLSEGTIPPGQFGATSVTGGGQFLYATSGYAVYKISLATREITQLAGAFNESGTKDGIGVDARFANPTSVFNQGRYLFVVDEGIDGIRRVDVETGEVITIARGLPLPRGVWASGNDLYVVATAAQSIYRINLTTREARPFVNLPNSRILWRLWGDGAHLYVTDAGDCTIRKISLSTAEVSLLAGNPGCDSQTVKDGIGTEARFRAPTSIWGDGQLLFVTDGYTLRTVHPMTGETHTIAGDWQKYGTENGVGVDARFDNALSGIWGDGTYLYVGDRAIRRVTVPAQPVSSLNFAVQPGGGDYWKSSAAGKPLQIAYARLQANAGSSPPEGVVLFGFRPNGVLVSEASVSASPLVQSGRVYAETGSTVRTGIAIANPNNSSATVSFYFTDAAGLNFGSGVTTIAANQQIAAFLNEAPFNGTANSQSFTFTSSVPVGAITLRGFVNERSDFLMTTLPVAPVTSASNSTVVLPQYASGGGWTTQILLVNPTDEQINGTVEMDATYNYSIAPRSAAKVVTSNTAPDIRTGVVRVSPASGSRAAVSSSVFSFVSGGVTVTESGIATTAAAQSFRVFAEFDSAQSIRTGIAIANLSSASTTVQLELLDLDGQAAGVSGSSTITGNGHLSLFLNELPGFQNLPAAFRGVLRISSSLPISAIGLRGRYNERGDFLISTTPAIAENTPTATGELVFPHIATGGGYTTEFLLLNRGSASAGTISIFSQSGDKLPLPISK